jgi:hypothetical protein
MGLFIGTRVLTSSPACKYPIDNGSCVVVGALILGLTSEIVDVLCIVMAWKKSHPTALFGSPC